MRRLCPASSMWILAALAALCGSAHAQGAAPGTPAGTNLILYVAPGGNDAWSGRREAPTPDGTDGPLATLTGARDAVRALRTDGALPGPVVVRIREGVYHVTGAVTFLPEDSGTAETPVSYEAYPGESPVIHGGRAIGGWRDEGRFWTADLPEARDGAWDFGAFWVNGARCTPARTPNATHPNGDYPEESDYFYTVGTVQEPDPAGGDPKLSRTRFVYNPEELKAWPTLKDAVVVVFHSWATSLHRVAGLDEANSVIEFTGPARWPFGYWQRSGQRYYVEHLFEGLDAPGEWYLNRAEGKLHYIPRPGEDMTTADAVAPVARQLLVLQGAPADGRFIEHLTFRGLRFRYSEFPIAPQGHSDAQAAFSVPAALEAVGARHCVFERCEVAHVGTYGVWFRAGCHDNRLVRSELRDLGAGGVRIGEGADPESEDTAALRNVVDNCFIHDAGRIFREAVGVWIGKSSHNTISHNEICDIRYSGLSIGWSWGFAPSSANHNIVEYNYVHNIGKGQLSDMGVIYTLGVSPGTVIRNNVFHDSISYPLVSGGWGIYFDEGSTDILAENNLVYNTLTGGLHQHYGKENRVVNNIFAYSHRGQLIRSREEDHVSFIFERNIVLFNNGQLLGSRWENDNFRMADNVYWDTTGEEPEFAGATFEEWRAKGHDANSIVADPLFVDAESGDFRLKPDSPALALGFKPFDTSDVGLYGDAEWVNKPRQISRPRFSPPPLPEPYQFSDGFEDTPVGANAARAQTLGEEGAASIRVTADTAATGERSLKFTDAPGLAHAFCPYLVYAPRQRRGLAVARFALRLEPGAVMYHEWRDNHNPYRVGPSIWLHADGRLTSSGRELMSVPGAQWIRFEIACALGAAADGTYTLTVTLPDAEPRRFEGLPVGNPRFRALDWFGFVSNADAATVFYLDDVSLEMR